MARIDVENDEWSDHTVKTERKAVAVSHTDEPLVLVVSTGLVLPIPEGDVIHIGRARDCEITIPDISVSRRHLRLLVRERLIEDVGSANGSAYDGAVLPPHARVPFQLGRPIRLGNVTVFIHPARAIVAPDAAPASARIIQTGSIVRDAALKRVYDLLPTIAPSPLSVLILGETGVGKEVYADAIHRASPRRDKPFLKLNCAALPESIVDGELFGYERGAFSGAMTARPGLFESAEGGTVFLDEVGELTLATQAKLLRVLESGEVLRLGSRIPIRVDVRFVAATNRNLQTDVAAGTFRRDLYYRLEGVHVWIPPLRERPEDIVALAEYFLVRLAARMALAAPRLDDSAKATLCAHHWPGNVRELRNVVERAFVMNPTVGVIEARHVMMGPPARPEPPERPTGMNLIAAQPIPPDDEEDDDTGVNLRVAPPSGSGGDLKASLEEVERQAILDALMKTGGNQSAAARMLGIGRHALIARIEAYGLTRPRKR